MKRFLIFVGVFFISCQLIGQDKNQLNEMIIESIDSYITWKNDFVRQGISLSDTCHRYICIDGLPLEFPYESIKNATFFSLHNVNGLPKPLQKKLKKGINACLVWINLTDNQLIISVGGRGIKFIKKGHIGIVVGDWSTSTYEYSCEKQKWLCVKTEYGDI